MPGPPPDDQRAPAALGSIFDATGNGGFDLHHRCHVPLALLVEGGSWPLRVPPRLEDSDGTVRDRRDGDRPVEVHVAPTDARALRLRLRGSGATDPSGAIGDLHLTLIGDPDLPLDRTLARPQTRHAVAVTVGTVGTVALAGLLALWLQTC